MQKTARSRPAIEPFSAFEGRVWIRTARDRRFWDASRMARKGRLPESLGASFRTRDALAAGVGAGRLRGRDLERPFHGVRAVPVAVGDGREQPVRRLAAIYAAKLGPGQFFSHSTAAVLWGAPVPLRDLEIHVGVFGNASLPGGRGIRGHRFSRESVEVVELDGVRVTSAASTWASLGELSVIELVVLGDHLCRRWRPGVGRQHVGRPPLATVDDLGGALRRCRRRGASRLREALSLIRTDSWSPRESMLRCLIVSAGLPEPELNVDVWSERGLFLGCVDLAYVAHRIAVEYQGRMHSETYARDVERIERLRADGWIVLQVTAELIATPHVLIARLREALRSRGAL